MRHLVRPLRQPSRLVGLLLVTAACGGADPNAPPPTPPPPPPPPAAVVTSVEVSAPGRVLVPGDTVRLTATVKDQNGNPMTGRAVAWSSGAETVATVSASGLVTALAQGQSVISATVESKVGSTPVEVAVGAASIELDRTEAVIEVGQTLQLSATVRDAQGNVLTGRAVTWTSTAPTAATVSGTGLVTAVRHGAAGMVASVEGRADTAVVRVPVPPVSLTLGAASAVTRVVGQAGDTLRATGPDGTTYQLAIPPLALAQPVPITMTPVVTAGGLPLAGGLIGGVDLAPSGLAFATTATLVITTTKSVAAGQRVVGLGYHASGDSLSLGAAKAAGGAVTMAIQHFSGALAGFGTNEDIEALFFARATDPTAGAYHGAELLMASVASPRDVAAERRIIEDWWDGVVMPALMAVTTDSQLVRARNIRNDLEWTADLAGTTELVPGGLATLLGPRALAWDQEFQRRAKQAIEGNLSVCRTPGLLSSRIAALDNALFWYRIATVGTDADPAAQGLTPEWLRGLQCATVVAEPVVLPDPLAVGTNTLDASFKLRLAPDNVTAPADFKVAATVTGASHTLPGATAATPAGFYTGTIVPDGSGDAVTILLTACYFHGEAAAALGVVNEVCGDHFISRGAESGFQVDYQGQLSMGAVSCNREFRELVTRFVNESETSACGAGGWSRTGSYTIAGTLPKARLETAMAKSGAPQGYHPLARLSAEVRDRITIDAPGQTGNIGSFRGQIEVRAVIEATSGVCNAVSSQGRLIARGLVLMEGTVFLGTGIPQAMFPETLIAVSTCGGLTANPWETTTTLFSTDMVFRYGTPFELIFRHRAESSVTQTGALVSGAANASVRYEYRWLGMLGLPAGATVRSATGFDWSSAAPP
ncbi:MAG: Ig-like domain-containing protein [Gemmatimonadales bacterium]